MAKVDPKQSTLSIVIPTLNEADFLPLLIADINLYPKKFELIIVDGSSTDFTKLIARLGGSTVSYTHLRAHET